MKTDSDLGYPDPVSQMSRYEAMHAFSREGIVDNPSGLSVGSDEEPRVDDGTPVRAHSAPEVSVVIPSYNYGRFLGVAIESVLSQQLRSFEIVIVDNASTDGTPEVVRPYLSDSRIHYVRNDETVPAVANWEKAVRLARGEFVAILSADDYFLAGHLGRLLAEMRQHPEFDLAYVPCLQVDETGAPIGKATHPGHPAGSRAGGRDEFPELLASDCYVTPSAALVRRSALPDPVFDRCLIGGVDWSLWVRLARKNPGFIFVDEPTCAYRLHGKQGSNDFYASTDPLTDHLTILEESLASPERGRLAGYSRRIARLLEIRISNYEAKQLEPFTARIAGVVRQLEDLDVRGKEPGSVEVPLVSVIVPTYNRPEMLEAAIRSIQDQTFRNFEIVVVNDAGKDAEDIVKRLNDGGNILYVRHDHNRGLAAARNTGIRVSRGKYLAYLDDDDRYFPDHLEKLVGVLVGGGRRVAYSDAVRAIQERRGDAYETVARDVPYSFDFDADRFLVSNYVPVLCFMHERRLIEEIGGFDETLTSHEDWDLWIRMSRKTEFEHLPQTTCEFSWRDDGSSMTSAGREDFLRTTLQVYGKYPDWVADRPILQESRRLFLKQLYGYDEPAAGVVPRISIVIPVFNNLHYTRPCIESIAANSGDSIPYELIVVDNGSTDGTPEFLSTLSGDVQVITNRENLGFSKACNQGAGAARGRCIVFLNNDTVVHPGWLDGILRAIEVNKADICGAKLLYPDGTIQHAGVVFDALNRPYHLFRGSAGDARYVNQVREFRCVTAACMGVRTDLFHELGGFDEEYRNGFEDVDFCLRAVHDGFKIVYTPECVVTHLESKTPGRSRFDKENLDRLQSKWDGKIRCDDLEACRSFGLIAFRMSDERAMFVDLGGELTPEREDALLATDPASVPYTVEGFRKEEFYAKFHSAAGDILARRRRFDEAAGRYRSAIDLGHRDALPDLGDCLAKAGRLEEAHECYDAALGLDGSKVRARIGLGTLALISGKPAESASWFREAVGLDPGNPNALCGQGMAAMAAGDIAGALDSYGKVLDADPSNRTAIHEMVRAAFAQERFGEAEARLRKFLEFEPSNAHLLFSLAGICHKQGKKADALDALDRLDLFSPGYDGSDQLRSQVTA